MGQRNRAGQCREVGVLLLVTFSCLAGAACAGGGAARAGGERALAGQLKFLAGTWADLGDERQVTAQWVAVHPRLLLGTTMVVRDTLLLGSAHQEIWLDGEHGRLLYQPHDGPPAELELLRAGAGEVVFQRQPAVFPHRVAYRLRPGRPAASLEISARGLHAGESVVRRWTLRHETPLVAPGTADQRIIVNTTPSILYRTWSTNAGLESFLAPRAEIEPEPGGVFELRFGPALADRDRPLGSFNGGRVVEAVADRKLVFTFGFPPWLETLRGARVLVEVRISRLAGEPGRSRVCILQSGYRIGQQWSAGLRFGRRFWTAALQRLRQRFLSGPIDWSAQR